MPDGKVYVRKEGAIHTVYEDTASGQPLPLSSFDDQPAGGALQTYMSIAEVERRFPGKEVICLEKQQGPLPPVIRRSAAVRAEAAEIVANLPKTQAKPAASRSKSQMKRLNVQQGKSMDEGIYQEIKPLSEGVYQEVKVEDDGRYEHAKEFLKRLEVAFRYASKKNQRTLEIQIDVIRELLEEVFE
jgi:hypothetical protein